MQIFLRAIALIGSTLVLVTAAAACGNDETAGFGGGGSAPTTCNAPDAGMYLCGPSLACDVATEFCVDLAPEAAMSDAGAVANACRDLPPKCCGKASCACIGKVECPEGRTSSCSTNADGTILVACNPS